MWEEERKTFPVLAFERDFMGQLFHFGKEGAVRNYGQLSLPKQKSNLKKSLSVLQRGDEETKSSYWIIHCNQFYFNEID